jgi:hypothetical protein
MLPYTTSANPSDHAPSPAMLLSPASTAPCPVENTPWAASCSIDSRLPDAFCWTKMQAESGQPLEHIVRRKEMERASGGGLFFWGVGNPLGDRVDMLLRRTSHPKVAFSVMRSRPKAEDSAPDQVLLWTTYVDTRGHMQPLPPHVLLLSRGSTSGGEKKRHYALVCRSDEPLELGFHGTIHLGRYRNLGSETPNVGASQVTAILEHDRGEHDGPAYSVDLLADLTTPHFVRLAAPRILTTAERDEVDHASQGTTERAWLQMVTRMRVADAPLGDDDGWSLFGRSAP